MTRRSVDYVSTYTIARVVHPVLILTSTDPNQSYDMPNDLKDAQSWLWAKIRPDQLIRTKFGGKTARYPCPDKPGRNFFRPGAIRTNLRIAVRTKTPYGVSGLSLYNQGSYMILL